jgi:hypothetical protein
VEGDMNHVCDRRGEGGIGGQTDWRSATACGAARERGHVVHAGDRVGPSAGT